MKAFSGAQIFDGHRLRQGVLLVNADRITGIAQSAPEGAEQIVLAGGILAPGLLDLQVNGGDGLWVCGDTDAAALARICAAHARLGATGILPTLITDTYEATAQVIAAGLALKGTPGFLGLHLEGPHLDPKRKGAHDIALIRAMDARDLALLCHAAEQLPALMVTVSPASVRLDQITALRKAGAIVSLGHSDCTLSEAEAAIAAGANCATHLFNAMSQMGHREPGLVGAVLSNTIAAGLIADGLHVSATAMRIATAARREGLFLVSDAMAGAGTDLTEIYLGGRKILREGGKLTLADGTLAGADLSLPQAIANMVNMVGLPLERALAMATSIPADLIGRPDLGRFAPDAMADFVHLNADLSLAAVWQRGQEIAKR